MADRGDAMSFNALSKPIDGKPELGTWSLSLRAAPVYLLCVWWTVVGFIVGAVRCGVIIQEIRY